MPVQSQPSDQKSESPGRKIAIAVDLSDESAYAVQWAVDNYLRPGDQVTILHVRPTSVLYGADWGAAEPHPPPPSSSPSLPPSLSPSLPSLSPPGSERARLEDEFSAFTESKSEELARPLVKAGVPFIIKIVRDHDMKERLCLEVERLRVSACIMGSRGIGAEKRSRRARLGSVSDYCVHHCDCPVIVVRMPEEKDGQQSKNPRLDLSAVPEEENAE